MYGINGRKCIGNIGMNVALRGGEFAVTHDLLDDGRSDVIAQSEGCCGGMAAGVGREITAPAAGKSEMEFLVEMIAIHAKDLFAGRGFAKEMEDGKNTIRDDDGGRFANLCF